MKKGSQKMPGHIFENRRKEQSGEIFEAGKLYSIHTVKETPLKSIPSEGGFQWRFHSMISKIL